MRTDLPLILACIAAVLLANGYLTRSSAQLRVFSHNTKAHKTGKYSDCASCHTLPTKNWTTRKVDGGGPTFPDVATFPYHTSCFGCHTQDIYKQGGAFCGTCHTVATMRARAVGRFPVRAHPTQFTTLFPHNVHQDIIASNKPNRDYAVAHFIPASFSVPDEKTKPTYYNCVICHEVASKIPKLETRKVTTPEDSKLLPAAVPDVFEKPIAAEFFKNSPNSHASCFTCHYQFKNLPGGKQSCIGCHELSKPFYEKQVTRRYSLKFNHEREGHKSDCATCHVRITQNGDVRTMKDADVPIVTCRFCHAKQEDAAYRKIITTEVETRLAAEKENKPAFQCTYCHTSEIGRRKIPASHLSN
ncbi:MAG: cytochrome c3 family protein [Pyrinomonadaceae bacterium]